MTSLPHAVPRAALLDGAGTPSEQGAASEDCAHQCACGAELPDGRSKFCPACRGARAKRQDLARTHASMEAWRQSIWWLHFAAALKVAIFMRADGRLPTSKHRQAFAHAAGVRLDTLETALAEQPIDKRAFHRLCKAVGQRGSAFTHEARDAHERREGAPNVVAA